MDTDPAMTDVVAMGTWMDRDPEPGLRALALSEGVEAARRLCRMLESPDPNVRRVAVRRFVAAIERIDEEILRECQAEWFRINSPRRGIER